jgi:hypothetical protein
MAWGMEVPDNCFFCGERATLPMFCWHGKSMNGDPGDGHQLWMHKECSKVFAKKIEKDQDYK